MIFAIILSCCSLHARKVFILADGTVQLVRPKCSFWGDIFTGRYVRRSNINSIFEIVISIMHGMEIASQKN